MNERDENGNGNGNGEAYSDLSIPE